jgi:hypothetical protein
MSRILDNLKLLTRGIGCTNHTTTEKVQHTRLGSALLENRSRPAQVLQYKVFLAMRRLFFHTLTV